MVLPIDFSRFHRKRSQTDRYGMADDYYQVLGVGQNADIQRRIKSGSKVSSRLAS